MAEENQKELSLEKYLAIYQSFQLLSQQLFQLARLELTRSAVSAKKLLSMYVFESICLIFLYASLCASTAWIVFDLTNSAVWASAALIGFQLLILCALKLRADYLKNLIGMPNTKQHIENIYNEFTKTTESPDSPQK